jgi:Tfp pilus assembly protein PilV
MVAMLISLISMFALLNALQMATEANAKNLQREEAVQIAANRMNRFRALPFAQISSSYATEYVQPAQRGATGLPPFRVVKSSVSLSSSSKLVNVRVRWVFKNMSTSHEVQSVMQQ